MDDFIFGIRAVMEAITAGKDIEKILLRKNAASRLHQELFRIIRDRKILFQFVPVEKLNQITRKNHQGVVAFISAIDYASLDEMVARSYESGMAPFILILDKLSDVRNFGAIARTAECAGISGIIIPAKNSVRVSADAVKTSAGALFKLPVARVSSLQESVQFLKNAGLTVIAATEKSENMLFDADLSLPIAIILGSEDTGISPDLLKLCDSSLKIPLFGEIKSLNVSVAASVIMYEAVRQRILKE